ncbi:hypothetical protein KIH39_15760 [Telmatocola sphagniphila]|uniref:Uncharacterized protein n=1 Tax=Telmatocola sphagniphila TaxID=1123043 RepID=A0A8E6EW84_9BACT|nr:hypothetical protein [Telmatocola sphagniphila]QVL30308.1 hypothetical protein KIH39_15760 [Telmatocola sphagniphila]
MAEALILKIQRDYLISVIKTIQEEFIDTIPALEFGRIIKCNSEIEYKCFVSTDRIVGISFQPTVDTTSILLLRIGISYPILNCWRFPLYLLNIKSNQYYNLLITRQIAKKLLLLNGVNYFSGGWILGRSETNKDVID